MTAFSVPFSKEKTANDALVADIRLQQSGKSRAETRLEGIYRTKVAKYSESAFLYPNINLFSGSSTACTISSMAAVFVLPRPGLVCCKLHPALVEISKCLVIGHNLKDTRDGFRLDL
jgi:hypothetical protein